MSLTGNNEDDDGSSTQRQFNVLFALTPPCVSENSPDYVALLEETLRQRNLENKQLREQRADDDILVNRKNMMIQRLKSDLKISRDENKMLVGVVKGY